MYKISLGSLWGLLLSVALKQWNAQIQFILCIHNPTLGMDTLSGKASLSKLFLPPFWKGVNTKRKESAPLNDDDDDEIKFNNMSTHKGHLGQNGILTWFGIEIATMITSHILMKI